MIESIKALYRSLPGWAQYWIMRLLVAGAAAFVASTWMSVAVYAYAVRYAARFPLEGVSFVALLGGMAGFIFTLASMFLFYELPKELRKFHIIIIEENIRRTHTLKSRITANVAFLGPIVLVAALLAAVYIGGAIVTGQDVTDPEYWVWPAINWGFGFAAMLMVMGLAVNFPDPDSPWPRKIALRVFGAIVFAVALVSLLSPFDAFLRFIRFGGGLPVQIVSEEGASPTEACLFLVSDGAVTVYDKNTDRFVEYRRDAIIEVRYSPRAPGCVIPTRNGIGVPVPVPDASVAHPVPSSPMNVCCGGKCR